jgi:hypothetical protein
LVGFGFDACILSDAANQPPLILTIQGTLPWEVSEPAASGVKIYSDAAGSQEVTNEFGIEILPLIANRREIRSTPAGREMNRQIEAAMAVRQVALVKVTGLEPGVSYWMRGGGFGRVECGPRLFGTFAGDHGPAV